MCCDDNAVTCAVVMMLLRDVVTCEVMMTCYVCCYDNAVTCAAVMMLLRDVAAVTYAMMMMMLCGCW